MVHLTPKSASLFHSTFKVSHSQVSYVYLSAGKPTGLLEPPPNLEIGYHNATHQVLRWSPPFTLDLTAYEEDITGYSVTQEMESPPPRDPYDLSVSRDNLSSTSNETWSLPGHSLEFFFPRFSFPVWLSVRGENPVGLGAPSPPLQYSPPSNCTGLKGAPVSLSAMCVCSKTIILQMWYRRVI